MTKEQERAELSERAERCSMSLSGYGCGCPVVEKAEHFFFVVALSFLQEAGVLDVDHFSA